MSREFFKNLPDTTTPLNAQRMNSFLNGNEAMGSIVVDDISCKNLFNINNLTLETGSVDYSTGTITVNQYANASIQTLKQLCPDLIVGETYTLSLSTTSTDSKFIYLNGSSTPWMNGTQRTITQADLDGTIIVYGVYDSTDTFYISNIQIEKGTVVSDYAPFKGLGYTSGSNENGSWVKYDDGRMECYGEIFLNNVAITEADGPFCYTVLEPYPFPQTFKDNPITVMEVDSVDPGYALWLRGTDTGASLTHTPKKIITNVGSVTANKLKVHYHTKGRWK